MSTRCFSTGSTVGQLEEWGPTPEQIARQANLAYEPQRPLFLLVAAVRG